MASCSQDQEQKAQSAIEEALSYLSRSVPLCQKAIDVLEDVGRQAKNVRYLQTLASAYACRGGFSELELFADITVIDSDAANFFPSLTLLSTSNQTEAESDSFNDLQTAIDILLYAGEKTNPSAEEQKTLFGERYGTNMNLQALYMILVQLGRFIDYYGDVNALGQKGQGNPGTCFYNYTGDALVIATAHGSNNCDGAGQGHPDLDSGVVTSAVAYRRLCQGTILINNLLDILSEITFPPSDDLGDLTTIQSNIAANIATLEALDPAMPAYVATLNQPTCEAYLAASAANDRIGQLFFASLIEGGLP